MSSARSDGATVMNRPLKALDKLMKLLEKYCSTAGLQYLAPSGATRLIVSISID
ncbi:hypothetical protein INT50_00460 (plasmid) [Vibrio diabolicus]|uniref:hypothetical protein n=1 Tax=Vibrio alginolyticus TaxID=663 RepID=UPI0018A5B9AB|nr:hypothetical protein INT50_00460 [Vibrio diabolicus]